MTERITRESVLKKELLIADRTLVTCRPLEAYEDNKAILLPKNVVGLFILDAGAGCSDITANLLERGANGFALDVGFDNPTDLSDRAEVSLTAVRSVNPILPDGRKVVAIYEAALQKWKTSIESKRDIYRQGTLTEPPFPEESFDIVVSLNCLTGWLDRDWDVFSSAFIKMMWLLKTGGQLQIFPYSELSTTPTPGTDIERFFTQKENQQRMLEWLDDQSVPWVLKPTKDSNGSLLIVTKPDKAN